MSENRLIVGLGNPGKDYEFTRHNLGFLVVQYLAQKIKCDFRLSRSIQGHIGETIAEKHNLTLLMPNTYVNGSGFSVKKTLDDKGFDYQDILVVCDDLSLDFGEVRLRARGSDGGHNGLKSISEALETQNFARLRLGIGHPGQKGQVVDHVLTKFRKQELDSLGSFIDRASQSCLVWVKHGINKAMDQFNRRK